MKIAIIGGGAAGMMAAATILQKENQSDEILLFEKNNILGAKVRISGGGRCNLTTGITNTKELLTKYPRGAEFIEYALRKFTPKSIYKRFETNGLPLQMQDDLRAFPASNKGSDVVKVFEDIFAKYHEQIHIYTKSSVSEVKKLSNGQFEIYIQNKNILTGVSSEESSEEVISKYSDIYIVDKVIISTGGSAYGQTGSTGDGYDLASKLGHTITKLGPSLNSFLLHEKNIYTGLQGLAYPSRVSFIDPHTNHKRYIYNNIVWTHFGISGPAIFAVASHLAFEDLKSTAHEAVESENMTNIYISYQDHGTDYRKSQLETYISQNSKKQIRTMLSSIVPERLALIILNIGNIDGLSSCGQLSKNDKIYIYKLLSDGIPVSIADRRPGDEFVTAGGVNTNEINEKTMESLICPGLYFGGEVIDVDGYTGGFNLTACWASGRLIGLSL